MLHEFVTVNRESIILRTRDRLASRDSPPPSRDELDNGVPMFLTQLSETLRSEAAATPFVAEAIGSTAARHGAELETRGFSLSQVVHDYGDICQAITELAIEQHAPITTEEFHTLNRCLDDAIAEAVTEHARLTSVTTSGRETERLGLTAHELRDALNTALLAFEALKRGSVAIGGSTGTVLGRSLTRLGQVIENTLAEVRLEMGKYRHEPMHVRTFLESVADAARLHANDRAIQFTAEPVDPELTIHADSQLLMSAVMNLLQNALKSTRPGGRVVLRARRGDTHVLIEVEDECGGIPESASDPVHPVAERRGRDRKGLGLGLSIARKAVKAHGGDIHIRNMPGTGCVFVVEIPIAVNAARDADVMAGR
jgi:signal transduction histidine kinase